MSDIGDGRQEQSAGRLQVPPIVQRLEAGEKTPVCVLMVGMAGSGKTSLLSQMQEWIEMNREFGRDKSNEADSDLKAHEKEEDDESVAPRTYGVNLDPATHHLPFEASIDIRDTLDYKEIMKQHNLGPNGAIMTSLNLFATKLDQVVEILEKRAYDENEGDESMEYILVDTPGQIEAFTWSASGSIICEALASSFPTVLCFVVDTARCASSPNTFMSNMLYACSMFYRTRLPLVIAFNKNDVVPHQFALEWVKDYEAFQEALDENIESSTTSTGFYGSLTRSLSLVLDEFYSNFTHCVGVSAVTGDGMEDFFNAIQTAATNDFSLDYIEDLKNRIEEQDAKARAIARSDLRRLRKDLDEDNDIAS